MEPPASSDPVKEACAPLADIDSEEEVCHPVQQPQAHSIPHSSPPTGTAGIGQTSHSEEPMTFPNKREEEEEELELKAKKKDGESGQDSDEYRLDQDMKNPGMESEADRDQYEYVSSIHTCYHSSFFLLRTPVTVCGKPVEIRLYKGSPALTYHHSEQECRVSLSAMSRIVKAVLLKHGVYHMDTFYYEQVPLFSVVFSSKASLKRFLTVAGGRVKRELESAIGEEFTKQLTSLSGDTSSNSQPSHCDVSINIESYLITPDRQEGTADVQLVTLANYFYYSSKWQNSRMFDFAHIFQTQLQHGIQKSHSRQKDECAELKDLVNELQSVTEWFRLGMNLDIPDAKLMQLHHDYKHTAECLDHMLIEWGKRERRTWSKVVRALTAIGRTLLAQELARKYGVNVPVEETASPVHFPVVPVSADSENADYRSMMVSTVRTKVSMDPEHRQTEKQLKSKEEQLEASNASRGEVKVDISETMESLQRLQIQLRTVIKDREDIKVKLEKKKKKCEQFYSLKESYKKMLAKSREDIEFLEETLTETEQEVKELEGKLEQKESEFHSLEQELSKVQENLSQKTSELQKKTSQVLGLEMEVKQLKVVLSNKGKELDMEMRQMIAKASSEAAYVEEMKLHVSSMREELVAKKKEFDDCKERMTEKEEKIRQLTQMLHSQNIQKENLERELRAVDGAKSTTDTVQNSDELVSISIDVSKLTAELDDTNREKHQMMLENEITSQDIKRLKESIRKLMSKILDPSKCRAVGAGLESAKKHQFSEFKVEVADVDGEPWTSNDGITIIVEVTSIVDELTIAGNVVSETPAVSRVSYQPIKSGEHEISVKVNGTPINNSPFAIFVHNNPHPNKCKAIGEQVESALKNNPAKFIVQLADEDGDPCVTSQEVTVELKSLMDGSITKADVVSQTPATYEVAYQPSKSGEHEIIVKVNGMEINGSPFVLLVHNIPDPQNCKAVGEGITKAEKHKTSEFMVELADAEGDPCVTKQEVTAELKSLADDSIIKANVVSQSQTPATYEVAYQPSKSGEHEIIVKVNGMEINGSPFAVLVHNIPDPQNCKAVGEGITKAEKHKTSEFMVQLADAEGDPCVTEHEVVVELKSLVDGSITKANVVSKPPVTYAVSYQPSKSGEHELSVKVNDIHIEGSPFTLFVVNTPHTENCKAIGEHVKTAEKNKAAKFMIQLADEDGEPCATKQEVTIELKALVNGSITEGSVVSKTPATYEASFQPRRSGRHELSVKVNGMPIKGSPFAILIHNNPHPKNCKAIGEHVKNAEKNRAAKFFAQLADEDGEVCVSQQEVTVELKALVNGSITEGSVVSITPATYEVSYQPRESGRHKLIVKVNGMEIKGSPFALLVYNIPHAPSCKVDGVITSAEKEKMAHFTVNVVDAEGDPCVTKQEVVVQLKSLVDGSITKADVVSKTPATYAVSYQPSKSGEHELSVKVNDMHINGSPFELLVYDLQIKGTDAEGVDYSKNFPSPLLSPGTRKQTSPPVEITGNLQCFISPSQTKKNKRVLMKRYFSDHRSYIGLELFSPDIEAKVRERICRAIGAKYGGLLRASEAAITIQRAYRDYKLIKQFGEIRREMQKRAKSMQLDPKRKLSVVRQRQLNRKIGLEFPPEVEARIHKRICRAIGAKYGGLLRASEAAITIQRTYREYKLKKQFGEIRREAIKIRKRTESMHPVRPKMEATGKVEFPIFDTCAEMAGDMETAVCVIPIGQICGISLGESTTDPSIEARKSSAFPSDKLYKHHRLSIFSTSVSADNLEQLCTQVEKERATKKRKYSIATFQQKTSVGVNHFNRKPTKGIQYLVLEGVLEDDPRSVAEFLLNHYGLSKEKIGEFFGEISNEFNMAVLECLLKMMDLKEKPIDNALRQFQEIFLMPDKAQKIDKIMQIFALEYYRNNQAGAIKSEDGAYMLSFAIMMLNTALHNPSIQHRTTTKQWVSMNRGCNDGENFPESLLLDIYDSINKTEFASGYDHTHVVAQIERQITGSTLAKLAIPQRRFIYKISVTKVLDASVHKSWISRYRRTLFLFSDLVIVCKHKSSDQFLFRESFPLLNAMGFPFDSEYYKYGVQIYSSLDRKAIFHFNCDSAADRREFLAKFNETIEELLELETDTITELVSSLIHESESQAMKEMGRTSDSISQEWALDPSGIDLSLSETD